MLKMSKAPKAPKAKVTDFAGVYVNGNYNAEKWFFKWKKQEISEPEIEQERRARTSGSRTVWMDTSRQSGLAQSQPLARKGPPACTGSWNPNCRCEISPNGLGRACALYPNLILHQAPLKTTTHAPPADSLRKWALGSSNLGTNFDLSLCVKCGEPWTLKCKGSLCTSTGSLPQIGKSNPTNANMVRIKSASELARPKTLGGPWRSGASFKKL